MDIEDLLNRSRQRNVMKDLDKIDSAPATET